MLLTITTTRRPATDLGYLLHKHPARVQSFDFSFGQAYVFYPEVSDDRCTVALLLDIDPVGLVRGRTHAGPEGISFDQYVNDRPYVASSFLSVALSQVFSSAMAGKSRERADLIAVTWPLQVQVSAIPCRGGAALLQSLFEPMGYTVTAHRHPLDESFPEWGDSAYYTIDLQTSQTIRDLLAHLYVLIPVLDNEKHYWVGDDEVDKLLRHGSGWLATHPQRDLIAARYLKYQRSLMQEALTRLADDDAPDPDQVAQEQGEEEAVVEARVSLNEQRMAAVFAALKEGGASSILDLGCGEGRLLRLLLSDPQFQRIAGLDVSHRVLEIARDRLRLDRLAPSQRNRLTLLHGSLIYRDKRLQGFDVAAVVEVIEHLDPNRLAAFERVLFEYARPGTVVLTTPNVEYNVRFDSLPAGTFRHRDHRFEWTRSQFQTWATTIGQQFGYTQRFVPIGPDDVEVGSPTQMVVLTRISPDTAISSEDPTTSQ